MAGAIGLGYTASSTDAGLRGVDVDDWALNSPGNVNLYNLQNLASASLRDMALISKDLIRHFYGKDPIHSYWSGCSQGGRQGLMLAQKYPTLFDGIAAAAPAINWNNFIPTAAWGQFVMKMLDHYPSKCELDAVTTAAIEVCDALDGVSDGLVSDEYACQFDPFSLIGTVVNCSAVSIKISNATAAVANLTWTGPFDSQKAKLWFGPNRQSRLTSAGLGEGTAPGLASTSCIANGTCIGASSGLGEVWLAYFVEKDPSWDLARAETLDDFANLIRAARAEFDSIIGTNNPDLSAFRDSGGKMITCHGLADEIIPTRGSRQYYRQVTNALPDVADFYRYFEVPGWAHCSGGKVDQPTATFAALRRWVEEGVAPDILPISFNDSRGLANRRIVCPDPALARLKDGATDTTKLDDFECQV